MAITPQAEEPAPRSEKVSPVPSVMVTPAVLVVRFPVTPRAFAVPVFVMLTLRLPDSPGLNFPSPFVSFSKVAVPAVNASGGPPV